MKLSDFDFDLPENLIATRPARPRSSARMLVAGPDWQEDAHVFDLPAWLRPGDRLVLNDTRVIPARLFGTRTRDTGQGPATAKIEATLVEPTAAGTWRALIRPLRKLAEGEEIRVALAEAGAMPLPPYIAAKRPADAQDREDYQTVWAEKSGAVAAPTASLHFDEPLLAALADRGVVFTHVTLHVGAGTFLPVKTDDVSQHRMHSEWGEVSERAAAEIAATKAAGGRVIPVGTTALRLIETAAQASGGIAPWRGDTDIFIKPGFQFRVTDALMTNFHLPKSTLLMLVSALMGRERMLALYRHAVLGGYRFFSYGDASLLLPKGGKRPG